MDTNPVPKQEIKKPHSRFFCLSADHKVTSSAERSNKHSGDTHSTKTNKERSHAPESVHQALVPTPFLPQGVKQ